MWRPLEDPLMFGGRQQLLHHHSGGHIFFLTLLFYYYCIKISFWLFFKTQNTFQNFTNSLNSIFMSFSHTNLNYCTTTFLLIWTDNTSHHISLKNARRQLQKIKVQDPIHPKLEKYNLKQLSKQHTNITWTMLEPLFTFRHNLKQRKRGII
jgi:hypothetical protein